MNKDSIFEHLKRYLDRSWKKDEVKFNSSSVAITTTNNYYYSGDFESKTHILRVPSEQGAISLAVASKDPKIKKVVTLVDTKDPYDMFYLNLLVWPFFINHAKKTDCPFSYEIWGTNGNTIFSSDNVLKLLPSYNPSIDYIEKIETWKPRPNKSSFDSNLSLEEQLVYYAKLGAETHFTSSDSLYGSAVLAGDNIYFGGAYTTADHRLGLHAEMVACLSAIMDGNREISHLALVSTKFKEEVPQLCGICRQFLVEIQQETKIPIKIICFPWNEKKKFEINLEDYLPYAWDSKKSEKG